MGRFKTPYQIYDCTYFTGNPITPTSVPNSVFKKWYENLEVKIQDGGAGKYNPTKIKKSFLNGRFYEDVVDLLASKYGLKPKKGLEAKVSDDGLEATLDLSGTTIREKLFGHTKSRKLTFKITRDGDFSVEYKNDGASPQYMVLADMNTLYKVLNRMAKCYEKNAPAPAAPNAGPQQNANPNPNPQLPVQNQPQAQQILQLPNMPPIVLAPRPTLTP
jgi:hypothetical protein